MKRCSPSRRHEWESWIVAFAGALVVLGPAFGASEPLSRADAVKRALEANPMAERSRQDQRILNGRRQEALADALPDISLMGSALRYRDPSLLNSSSFDEFPEEFKGMLRPIPANLYGGSVQVRQTLFSFRVGKAIRASRLAVTLGKEQVRQAEQSVALQAIQAYNAYLLSLEKVLVAANAFHQKEKHLEMARIRRAAGVATDLDVLRSQVDAENQRTQLLRARGQSDLMRANLNAVMVRPIDALIEPTDPLIAVPLDATLDMVVAEALRARPEMKSADLSERIYDQLIGIAAADFKPRLDASASWGYSVRKPSNFFKSDFTSWNMSLTLTVPVFNGWRTSGRVAQAKGERGKVTQDRVAIENAIRLEAKESFDRLNVARSILDAAEMNVVQARKAQDMTQANYSHGAATTLDVLDAQAALTLAESLRLEALFEHANARAALLYVMGRDPLGAENKIAEARP
jgi:outer membrane protein TolC